MAITVGTPDAVGYAALGSTSRTVTVDAGSNFLLAFIFSRTNLTTHTMTYNGVSMTLLASLESGSIDCIYAFYLANPATGANTLAWTVNATPAGAVCAIPFSGVNTSTPFHDQGAGALFSSATANPGANGHVVTLSAVGELVFSAIAVLADTDLTVTPSFTQQWNVRGVNANTTRCVGQTTAGAATSVDMTNTHTSTHWNAIGVSLQPAAGGSDPVRALLGVGV